MMLYWRIVGPFLRFGRRLVTRVTTLLAVPLAALIWAVWTGHLTACTWQELRLHFGYLPPIASEPPLRTGTDDNGSFAIVDTPVLQACVAPTLHPTLKVETPTVLDATSRTAVPADTLAVIGLTGEDALKWSKAMLDWKPLEGHGYADAAAAPAELGYRLRTKGRTARHVIHEAAKNPTLRGYPERIADDFRLSMPACNGT